MHVTRVRRVIEAAKRVAARRGDLVDPIVASTGLSRAGVLRGFRDHLELEPSDEDIACLVRAAGIADVVHVILSANVFVAPLRAIALAVAAAPRVVVRPSSRDPVLATALIDELADSSVTRVASLDVATIDRGELHVYGRDATIAELRRALPASIPLRGHGAGMGIAVIPASSSIERDARDLAADVVPFDQRGCLSPRLAFVVGDEQRARDFAMELDRALDEEGRITPRGALHPDESAEARRYVETLAFAGRVFEGATHAVGVGATLVVPPPGRHVHVLPVRDLGEASAALAPIARSIVAVGVNGAATLGLAHARVSALGRMQRPPLDGPVDLR